MEYFGEIYKTEYAIFAWIIAVLIAVVGLLSIIKSGHELVVWCKSLINENPEKVDLSKRTAMKAFAGITVLSLIWVNGRKIYTDYINSKKVIHVSEASGLIAHKRTGTIHLAGISKGALPSKRWATKKLT